MEAPWWSLCHDIYSARIIIFKSPGLFLVVEDILRKSAPSEIYRISKINSKQLDSVELRFRQNCESLLIYLTRTSLHSIHICMDICKVKYVAFQVNYFPTSSYILYFCCASLAASLAFLYSLYAWLTISLSSLDFLRVYFVIPISVSLSSSTTSSSVSSSSISSSS